MTTPQDLADRLEKFKAEFEAFVTSDDEYGDQEFGQFCQKNHALILASLRAVAPAPADQSDAGRRKLVDPFTDPANRFLMHKHFKSLCPSAGEKEYKALEITMNTIFSGWGSEEETPASNAGHGISSEELRRIDPINPGFIDALEEVNRRESDAGRIERVAEVLKNRLPFVIAGEDMRDLARVVVALSKSESDAGRDGVIEECAARAELCFKPSNVDNAAGRAANQRHALAKAIAKSIRALASAPSETVGRGEVVVSEIAIERRRQITIEGWTPQHDDSHKNGEMALAAACYATPPDRFKMVGWPWSFDWWKPKSRRRDLIRAAALIVAEIERLDRAG